MRILAALAAGLVVVHGSNLKQEKEKGEKEEKEVNGEDAAESSSSTSTTEMGKPNILMVLVDDQGHSDIDMGGGKSEFHTPTLAAWATEGVKLANFYSAATCTPSRAMLMTGRYTIRYGFQDSVIHATEPRGVPLSETFLPEKLKKVGYSTVMIGKW